MIIGQDNCWAEIDNSSGLENLISHENNSSSILRTKLGWSQIIQGGLRPF